MMEVRLSEGTLERKLARPPRIPPCHTHFCCLGHSDWFPGGMW